MWEISPHTTGGQRIAERVVTASSDKRNCLHGGHLGSTSKVTCGNAACGTLASVVPLQYYYA